MTNAMAQDKPAYVIYDKEGRQVSYEGMLKDAAKADLVFFGEQHNNPICHWLELQITKSLYDKKQDKLVLGAEMFEADNQLILDEYLAGTISERNFEAECRLWDNYKTDYKPLVEFAKENKLTFVASNIPRRYASVVYKQGLNQLSSLAVEAKQYIAPLPVEVDLTLPGYKALLEMDMHGEGAKENFPHSQAIKDATMAHFNLQYWKKGITLLHFNGAYHTNNFEGIIWYVQKEQPKAKLLSITSVEQDSITKLSEENIGAADYIICIPADMTKTY